METKKAKNYVDHSFGFPVNLGEVTKVKMLGHWAPKIDYRSVDLKVLKQLSRLARPLTGAEVRYVRQHFELTLSAFAEKFGISHVAVHKWERRGKLPTGMQWSTEKDLRLFIQSQLSKDSRALGLLYLELSEKPVPRKERSRTPVLIAA